MPHLHTYRANNMCGIWNDILESSKDKWKCAAVWYIFCVYGTIWEHLEWYVNYTKTVHNYNVVLELTCLCVLLFCFVGNTTIDLNSPSCESKKFGAGRLPTVCIGSSWQIGTAVTQLNNLLEQHIHLHIYRFKWCRFVYVLYVNDTLAILPTNTSYGRSDTGTGDRDDIIQISMKIYSVELTWFIIIKRHILLQAIFGGAMPDIYVYARFYIVRSEKPQLNPEWNHIC